MDSCRVKAAEQYRADAKDCWASLGPTPCCVKPEQKADSGTHLPCSQYEWTHSRLLLSHSLTVLSSLADTMSRPSGENLSQTGQKPHGWLTDILGTNAIFHSHPDLSVIGPRNCWGLSALF